MKTDVKFNYSNKSNRDSDKPTWSSQRGHQYQDELLTPEYRDRRLRFNLGVTTLRILPALEQSAWTWMMGLHVLEYSIGRHVHPKTLNRKSRSVFDKAYEWMKKNQPQALFSKQNRAGARLLTNPHLLCWVLIEEHGKPVARLLHCSGYDGSRGGLPGLGFQILGNARELDAEGNITKDAVDPKRGYFVEVEKSQGPGAKYPSHRVRMSGIPAPLDPILSRMSAEEVEAICPLENVVHAIAEEDEWRHLETVLGTETVAQIRAEDLVNA